MANKKRKSEQAELDIESIKKSVDKDLDAEFDGGKTNAGLSKMRLDRSDFTKENNEENLRSGSGRASGIDNTKSNGKRKKSKVTNKVEAAFAGICIAGSVADASFTKSMKKVNEKLKSAKSAMERYANASKDVFYYVAEQTAKELEKKKERKNAFKQKMTDLGALVKQIWHHAEQTSRFHSITSDTSSRADDSGRKRAGYGIFEDDYITGGVDTRDISDQNNEPAVSAGL